MNGISLPDWLSPWEARDLLAFASAPLLPDMIRMLAAERKPDPACLWKWNGAQAASEAIALPRRPAGSGAWRGRLARQLSGESEESEGPKTFDLEDKLHDEAQRFLDELRAQALPNPISDEIGQLLGIRDCSHRLARHLSGLFPAAREVLERAAVSQGSDDAFRLIYSANAFSKGVETIIGRLERAATLATNTMMGLKTGKKAIRAEEALWGDSRGNLVRFCARMLLKHYQDDMIDCPGRGHPLSGGDAGELQKFSKDLMLYAIGEHHESDAPDLSWYVKNIGPAAVRLLHVQRDLEGLRDALRAAQVNCPGSAAERGVQEEITQLEREQARWWKQFMIGRHHPPSVTGSQFP